MGAVCVRVYVCTYTPEQSASHFFELESTHALNSGNRLSCGCARVALLAFGELWDKAAKRAAPPSADAPKGRMQILVYFWIPFITGEVNNLMGMHVAAIVGIFFQNDKLSMKS